MKNETILLFVATVLPLICTPGPDMLFVTSQALTGAPAGLRATSGICLGYVVHSVLVAMGVAAIVATSPLLFAILRWFGIGYLIYLAGRLFRSAMRGGGMALVLESAVRPLRRGFLTAVLNPKGMMIYFALLPQFIRHDADAALSALLLSAIFIVLCGTVYSILSIVVARLGKKAGFNGGRRRWVEGVSGGLLLAAAGRLALG